MIDQFGVYLDVFQRLAWLQADMVRLILQARTGTNINEGAAGQISAELHREADRLIGKSVKTLDGVAVVAVKPAEAVVVADDGPPVLSGAEAVAALLGAS